MRAYTTISEAITDLQCRGYTIDFNLDFHGHQSHEIPFELNAKKFKIVGVHRFEGETDPADEAVLYVIESPDGKKGTLLNGFGIYADTVNDKMVRSLTIAH